MLKKEREREREKFSGRNELHVDCLEWSKLKGERERERGERERERN